MAAGYDKAFFQKSAGTHNIFEHEKRNFHDFGISKIVGEYILKKYVDKQKRKKYNENTEKKSKIYEVIT